MTPERETQMWRTLTDMSNRVLAIDERTRDLHEAAVSWPRNVAVTALLVATIALAVACGVAL